MKSWFLSLVGVSGLLASLTVSAIGQQGGNSPVQKPYREVKLKIEWTGGYKGKEKTSSETVTFAMPLGERSMTNNVVNNADTYRKAVFFPELRPDGSYSVEVTVSESTKEQEYPRMTTSVVLKPGETKVIQYRTSKDSTGEYEYFTYLTEVKD